MGDQVNSIKIKTIKVGWVRETVKHRGKKFVYGYWRKPCKLLMDWTIEPIQDLVILTDYETLNNKLMEQFRSMSNEQYEECLAKAYASDLTDKCPEEREIAWQHILFLNEQFRP